MKFFFIVGESSGDALAASLITALKQKHGENIECLGVGGPKMKAAGFNELLPMDQISVIGLWEVLPKIPRLIKLNKAIVEEIEKQQPNAVITVDFPDFNFIAAKSLKKRGIFKGKLIHYVAPSVWAWRPERAKNIAQFMDGIMCLFPMEVEYFTKHGMKASHVGHPLVTSNVHEASGADFRRDNKIPEDAKVLGILFGSRESEFKNLSAVIKKAATMANEIEPDICCVVPTLPHLEYEVQTLLEGFELPVYIVANEQLKWQAIKACNNAIVVSGTAALEVAYAEVPHLITYKINPITALILKFMVKIKFAHLVNILFDKEIVTEFLQGKCVPELIAQETIDLFQDEEKCKTQIEQFKKLDGLLGKNDTTSPSEKAANFVVDIVKGG